MLKKFCADDGAADELVRERYALSTERIRLFFGEDTVREPFAAYFREAAGLAGRIDALLESTVSGKRALLSLKELEEENERLFREVLPENYGTSFLNPAFAAKELGAETGPLLSAFYAQLRAGVAFAAEGRLSDITILFETLIALYNLCEQGDCAAAKIRDILYWFFSDYTDVMLPERIREQLDPSLRFAYDIVMESDLSDLRYLYRFGEYISQSEMDTAAFLNTLPQETICRMAAAFTEGYREGFSVMGRDLSKKKTVQIRYEIGFERMIREAVRQFEAMGLSVIFCRAPLWLVNKTSLRGAGYKSAGANRQAACDHQNDQAVFLDRAYRDRRLGVLKTAYEAFADLARQYAGPAVLETFGEPGFTPETRPEALILNKKQEEVLTACRSDAMSVVNRYIPGEETSFTIISFPVPAVGADFEAVFRETIEINTLDNAAYRTIQQHIIDVLDTAGSVEIQGGAGNDTSLTVSLHPIRDPERETKFENCVSDVNIPLGEVFTSPVLKGTTGLLHVKKVYIGQFQFKDLRIRFEDGWVKEADCANFEDPEAGRLLIRRHILNNHDSLPMGEFAIGTNTRAYAMAERYGIGDRLPILIAEKTGPHFAVGDTCYSWAEDAPMYNPDGKEVIARDNEVSLLRRSDPAKAYFGCHTDITIPYAELGNITAVSEDGTRTSIIRGGRFVCEGSEELNRYLDGAAQTAAKGDL